MIPHKKLPTIEGSELRNCIDTSKRDATHTRLRDCTGKSSASIAKAAAPEGTGVGDRVGGGWSSNKRATWWVEDDRVSEGGAQRCSSVG